MVSGKKQLTVEIDESPNAAIPKPIWIVLDEISAVDARDGRVIFKGGAVIQLGTTKGVERVLLALKAISEN